MKQCDSSLKGNKGCNIPTGKVREKTHVVALRVEKCYQDESSLSLNLNISKRCAALLRFEYVSKRHSKGLVKTDVRKKVWHLTILHLATLDWFESK